MRKLYLLIILATFWMPMSVVAQDGHYWTQQYGTKSMLLSGSVIGGVDDLGAVYYNPARLAVIANPAFLLSASVYEYNSLTASDAVGSKQSVSKSEIKGVPTLAAGTFKLKFLPNHHFAYAITTRQLADMSFSYRNEVNTDVFDTVSLPGNEWFNGEVGFKGKGNEQWIGITWSHTLSKKLSIGVTTNLASNSQTKGSNIYLRALSTAKPDSAEVATYQYSRNYDYSETGLLWKIGLAGQFGPWSLGLTIKTPMVRLSGGGNYSYEEYFSTMPGIRRQTEIYTSSTQSGLEAKSRSPWAIGFGATRMVGKNKLHMSTEWYSAVSKYTLMQAQDHVSQSNPSSTNSFILTDEAKSVWNAGIGAEIYINPQISGFASFSTDFSSVANDITRFVQRLPESSNNSWKADFYNFGGGVVLDFKGVDLTLGVTHTGASQTIPRLINFPEEGGGGNIFDPTQTSDLKWDRWRFVFSFSFPFLADMAKKMQADDKGEKK
jgi:hypothetical protein